MPRTTTRVLGAAAIVVAMITATAAPTNARPSAPERASAPTGEAGPSTRFYRAMTPCRVLDTRFGGGGKLASQDERSYQISGDGPSFAAQGGTADGCDIPAYVDAVEASITAVSPTGSGYFRAWPKADAMPNATFLNYTANQGTTNTGTIALDPGKVLIGEPFQDLTVKNFGGPTHYVIDIQGYYGDGEGAFAPSSRSSFVPLKPCRVVDTRLGGGGIFESGDERSYVVTEDLFPESQKTENSGRDFSAQGGNDEGCGIPRHAIAVETSVSAVFPAGTGYLRAWPAGESEPNATILNYSQSQGTTNTGTIKLAADPSVVTKALAPDITVRSLGGPSHFVIDVQGYFISQTDRQARDVEDFPAQYAAIVPCRILDTRFGGGRFASLEQRTVQVVDSGPAFATQGGMAGGCDIPTYASAVEATITAVEPRSSGFTRAWPSNTAPPNATVVNFTKNQSTTNTGSIALDFGTLDGLTLRSFNGPTHYVIDIQGYYIPPVV